MTAAPNPAYIAFEGDRRIASGDLHDIARSAKRALDQHGDAQLLIFDGKTSGPVEIDFRGSIDDVLARLPRSEVPAADEDTAVTAPRGPGRPKLGVVAREVTLLPRHWDWLTQQKGGASVAIRKPVAGAGRDSGGREPNRLAQEA